MESNAGYFYPTNNLTDYDATLHAPSATFNPIDHDLSVDLDSFAGNDITPNLSHIPHLPPRQKYGGSISGNAYISGGPQYEEPFSDVLSNSNYDPQFYVEHQQQEARTPPLDTEDALLKFSPPAFKYPLLDYAYRTAPVSLEGQLSGMFFSSAAESPTPGGDEPPSSAKSITCYRRNLFSVTGNISVSRSLRYISTEHGEQLPIVSTEATISATESMEGAPVKLIAVPFKGNNAPPDINDKTDTDPHTIPVDFMGEQGGAESTYLNLPLAWKRLQFRASTANNGRRKELQQHFVIRINLLATLTTGQCVCLADVATGPIVVRGRSPRNFASKKDVPTSGSISSIRKPPLNRFASTGMMPPIKSESEYQAEIGDFGMHADPWQYRNGGAHGGAMTALPPDTFRIDPNEFFAQSSPDIPRYAPPATVPPPLALSLLEDSPAKRPSMSPSTKDRSQAKVPRFPSMKQRPSFSLAGLTSLNNDETNDPLYEYFPLGLDDWQEPVDAVYRPHVVHHIALPLAAKDVMRQRSKRYFSDTGPG